MRCAGPLVVFACALMGCSDVEPTTGSTESSVATEPGASVDSIAATHTPADVSVYPSALRQGDELTYRAHCGDGSDESLQLWFLSAGPGSERVGDPIEHAVDGAEDDPFWARVDLPTWQEPGTHYAEVPCPNGDVLTTSWKVLPPWPTGTMEVMPVELTYGGEVGVDLDCNVPMGDDVAYLSLGKPNSVPRQVVEVAPTAYDSHQYRAVFEPEYWWTPGRYVVAATCPGPRPEDVMPGDPAPAEYDPPDQSVELVAPADHRWDWWRPQVGPWMSPVPDGMIARHGQSWTVPAEGGSVTIAALCDGDIPRDGGARFIGYAPASSQSDADPMAWTVIEFPAERFIEAEGGGVYIESTLEFSPGDPSLVAIPWSELTVVARCAETPPFDPALNESSYWPDPPEHLHIGLFEFPPPPPDLTLAAESVRAGHRMGFTVDCRRAKEWDVEVSVALLGDDGTTVATDVVGKTTRDPRLWIFSGSLDTSTLEPGGFVAIASCAATDASGVVTMSEPEPFVVEP